MERKSILIAVPTFENISLETFKSIYGLQSDHILAFDYVKGYDCAKARNEIVKKAINGKFDYILMVDSDVVVPYNTIDLLMSPPADIVVGVYPRKNTDCKDTELFKMGTKDYVDRYTYDDLYSMPNRFQIKGSGMGCALIKTDIFEKLPFPYFKYVTYDDGSVLSEDLYFCSLLTQYGITIEADSGVQCGHISRGIQYC